MARKNETVLITGAAGFLGSSITIELAKEYNVVVVDFRKPSPTLVSKASGARWFQLDISDQEALASCFDQSCEEFGSIDYVVHFAAFWSFENNYPKDYQYTNIEGTRNVIVNCRRISCKRLIFASTLSVLASTAQSETLHERSRADSSIAYAKSKIENEAMVNSASVDFPVAILRIGATFTEWCELPPLYSIIQHWSANLIGRIIPSRGNTGFPYIHRDDLVQLVKCVIRKHEQLENCEWFLACGSETIMHKHIYPIVRDNLGLSGAQSPIHLPAWLVRFVLHVKMIMGRITGIMPDERPWMIDYVDKPWNIDNSYTRDKLGWYYEKENELLRFLPRMLNNYIKHRDQWKARKIRRNSRNYDY